MDLYQVAFLLGALVCAANQPPTIIPELTCATGNGESYRGIIAVTESGKTCQRWSDQTPHDHILTPENYPNKGLENNYCRNPDERVRPWCYTTDPDTRWEYCNVPRCGKAPEPGECMHCKGEDYRGTISTTKNGFTCQRWDSQEPHEHYYNPSTYPERNLEENYCRNPSRDNRPWCYTTNSSVRWEYCSIPPCTSEPPTSVPELSCITDKGGAYRGTIAVTESGKTCQKWSTQRPHKHDHYSGSYPCKGLENNYCRNPDPDEQEKPWCYTTDPRTRWEYCRVPYCDNAPKTEECIYCNGENYRGTNSTTENGFTCQGWNLQKPHSHLYPPGAYPEKYLEENYCRNPSGDPRPWCYTTNKSKRWDYCSIPHCSNKPPTIIPELSCATGKGKAYRGTIAVTESGLTCQRWSDQTPHEHNRTPENYPCNDLESNYCRNPDDKKRPWCFTTDRTVPWEYCSVPSCENSSTPEEECMHCNGENYRGKISTTRSGYTCQRWDSQGPHDHEYNPKNYLESFLEKNYCRNPSGDPWPWCYTTNPNKPWDYCSIPRCSSEPPTIVPEVTCMTGKGRAYRGTIAVTESGKTCQWWSSQTHSHKRTPENYPCGGLDRNYCRNPDNEKRPWCYTTGNFRWEYCSVPSCGNLSSPDTDLLTP